MNLINMCSALKYLPQWIIWVTIFCDGSHGLTCHARHRMNPRRRIEEFLNTERTNTPMESQENPKEPKLILQVFVNDKQTYNGTIYYDVGDRLRFSCDVLHEPVYVVYRNKIIHQWISGHQHIIPQQGTIRKFDFNIIADDLDNKSSIYCTMDGENINTLQSDIKELIMNPGTSKSDDNIIEYNEEHPTFTCNSKGSYEGKKILPATDSNSYYVCVIINKINESGEEAHYTREIYNKTIFKYIPMQKENNTHNASKLSNTSIIGIGLGVTVCIVLMGIVCLLYVVKKRRAKLQPPRNRDSVSNQVIYADLELSERPSRTILEQENDDTPYAQVIGIVQKNK
ncbi:uncharacterized protein LOC119191820 isoform X2 [Manduca sexta]|uniref:Uncharacterized protein n=1 Tax=Manduca sexta TaxID=7130 RepID=A0A921ZT03_MANSE|nr:uncharacterized protein LOC119191820 isoform X2 [Manduca sexta]KAG6462894.1 hypothetical protein O3G_MSEX013525 [Manduca sexta]